MSDAGATGTVPELEKHLNRYPFVFLMDVSGSTSREPDPDIHHINRMINELCATLRDPPSNTLLYEHIKHIDIAIVAYNERQEIIQDWCLHNELPDHIPELRGIGGTRMGDALNTAIELIIKRGVYYASPQNNISNGMPLIVHLTDGLPTDLLPIGSPAWKDLSQHLNRFDGTSKDEKRASIIHLCAPGAFKKKFGEDMTGAEILAKLSGKGSIIPIGKGKLDFDHITRFVTVIMGSLVGEMSVEAAVSEAKNDAPPEDDFTLDDTVPGEQVVVG